MSQQPCLSERVLLSLFNREGSRAQQNHLASCQECAAKYRQLASDLKAISATLHAEPAPALVDYQLRGFRFRWVPAAVAAMALVAMIWSGARLWHPWRSASVLQGFSNAEIWSLVEEMSADFFMVNEVNAEEPWSDVDDGDRLIAGSEDEWSLADGEVEQSEILADMPCPLCLERERSRNQRTENLPVGRKFSGYRMEVL